MPTITSVLRQVGTGGMLGKRPYSGRYEHVAGYGTMNESQRKKARRKSNAMMEALQSVTKNKVREQCEHCHEGSYHLIRD